MTRARCTSSAPLAVDDVVAGKGALVGAVGHEVCLGGRERRVGDQTRVLADRWDLTGRHVGGIGNDVWSWLLLFWCLFSGSAEISCVLCVR